MTPCDPCYGFHPTCWHSWSEYCAGLPPGGAGAGTNASPSGLELVPTPAQEPRVLNLPPPPQEGPSAAKLRAAPPLPEDSLQAPMPDKPDAPPKEDAKTDQPHALRGAALRRGTVASVRQVPESGDVAGSRELAALRRSISPPAPRASLPGVPGGASLADARRPRDTGGADPDVRGVAAFFGWNGVDPK